MRHSLTDTVAVLTGVLLGLAVRALTHCVQPFSRSLLHVERPKAVFVQVQREAPRTGVANKKILI